MTLTQHHPRSFRERKYVYPVVSRRSGGVSVGVNLTPAGWCNFVCVYCQILGEREGRPKESGQHDLQIDIRQLESELREIVVLATSGELFQDDLFRQTSPDKRALRDIAFSGNGEPTLSPQFPEAVRRVAAVRAECCPPSTKIVLITNGTRLDVPTVREACRVLHENNGEIWAKLDAGTEEHFRTVSRSAVPFERILSNLASSAREFPIVVQSCFLSLHGIAPSLEELRTYTARLREITDGGGEVQRVQLYTVARKTPEPWAQPLSDEQMNEIAETVGRETGLIVETFYSR